MSASFKLKTPTTSHDFLATVWVSCCGMLTM